jgi:hypothetical protein
VTATARDLLVRAFHTFWQAFTAAFGALYVASGINISQVTDIAGAKKVGLALVAAAGAAALSALKTTLAGSFTVSRTRKADDPALVAAMNAALDIVQLDGQVIAPAVAEGIPPTT